MPAPLLSMYNGGASARAIARFRRDRAATPGFPSASRSSD
jgi:hypothetical protein